jgi:hypothetical protein
VNFSNDGNARFLLVCDGENGYYTWTEATDTWLKILDGGGPGHINGVDPNLLDFVTIWKKRVWFVERDSGNAWYLVAGEFTGTATQFNFADQFRFGGRLVSLHNWTLDGGQGMDDYLVAVSSAGDIVVYQGTDPASAADFGLVGSWYVGEVPFGNRIATEFSGELYILSVYGLVAMSQVLNGASIQSPDTYITKRISPYIRQTMDDSINDFGWHVHVHPKQSLLFINAPPVAGKPQLAFSLYMGNNSWSMIRDLRKADTANWQGEVYWTSIDTNKIFIQRGHVDAVYLDPQTDGPPQAIEWSMLTAYTDFGNPVAYKRAQFIRPMFVANGVPAFNAEARYDFDIFEITKAPVFTGLTSGFWGDAGDAVFSMAGDVADLLYLRIESGDVIISGVNTIDVTIDARPLVTLTWSPTNMQYEVTDAGINAYLAGLQAQDVTVVMNPDTLPSQGYVMTVATGTFGNSAYGFRQPALVQNNDPDTPPVYTTYGNFQPSVISGTAEPAPYDGTWDIAMWGGGVQASDNPKGANGLGRHVAISIRGRTSEPTTLVSFDVTLDTGGVM